MSDDFIALDGLEAAEEDGQGYGDELQAQLPRESDATASAGGESGLPAAAAAQPVQQPAIEPSYLQQPSAGQIVAAAQADNAKAAQPPQTLHAAEQVLPQPAAPDQRDALMAPGPAPGSQQGAGGTATETSAPADPSASAGNGGRAEEGGHELPATVPTAPVQAPSIARCSTLGCEPRPATAANMIGRESTPAPVPSVGATGAAAQRRTAAAATPLQATAAAAAAELAAIVELVASGKLAAIEPAASAELAAVVDAIAAARRALGADRTSVAKLPAAVTDPPAVEAVAAGKQPTDGEPAPKAELIVVCEEPVVAGVAAGLVDVSGADLGAAVVQPATGMLAAAPEACVRDAEATRAEHTAAAPQVEAGAERKIVIDQAAAATQATADQATQGVLAEAPVALVTAEPLAAAAGAPAEASLEGAEEKVAVAEGGLVAAAVDAAAAQTAAVPVGVAQPKEDVPGGGAAAQWQAGSPPAKQNTPPPSAPTAHAVEAAAAELAPVGAVEAREEGEVHAGGNEGQQPAGQEPAATLPLPVFEDRGPARPPAMQKLPAQQQQQQPTGIAISKRDPRRAAGVQRQQATTDAAATPKPTAQDANTGNSGSPTAVADKLAQSSSGKGDKAAWQQEHGAKHASDHKMPHKRSRSGERHRENGSMDHERSRLPTSGEVADHQQPSGRPHAAEVPDLRSRPEHSPGQRRQAKEQHQGKARGRESTRQQSPREPRQFAAGAAADASPDMRERMVEHERRYELAVVAVNQRLQQQQRKRKEQRPEQYSGRGMQRQSASCSPERLDWRRREGREPSSLPPPPHLSSISSGPGLGQYGRGQYMPASPQPVTAQQTPRMYTSGTPDAAPLANGPPGFAPGFESLAPRAPSLAAHAELAPTAPPMRQQAGRSPPLGLDPYLPQLQPLQQAQVMLQPSGRYSEGQHRGQHAPPPAAPAGPPGFSGSSGRPPFNSTGNGNGFDGFPTPMARSSDVHYSVEYVAPPAAAPPLSARGNEGNFPPEPVDGGGPYGPPAIEAFHQRGRLSQRPPPPPLPARRDLAQPPPKAGVYREQYGDARQYRDEYRQPGHNDSSRLRWELYDKQDRRHERYADIPGPPPPGLPHRREPRRFEDESSYGHRVEQLPERRRDKGLPPPPGEPGSQSPYRRRDDRNSQFSRLPPPGTRIEPPPVAYGHGYERRNGGTPVPPRHDHPALPRDRFIVGGGNSSGLPVGYSEVPPAAHMQPVGPAFQPHGHMGGPAPGTSQPLLPPGDFSTADVQAIAEDQQIWFYSDPKGVVQGPHSIAQFRKWLGALSNRQDLRDDYLAFRNVAVFRQDGGMRVPLSVLLG